MTGTCPMCGLGKQPPMGALGSLVHFCCRACGMWFSKRARKRPKPEGSDHG